MDTALKNRFMHRLSLSTERIENLSKTIIDLASNPNGFCATEQISAYSVRLAECIAERNGICVALDLFGYHVKWENEKPVAIEEITE